ncbi:nucleotidyltransferase domain-containing protein [Microbacterium sp. LRZ72]|uniref:nucleotidyltransferase domain-containing protein n=1 Tax=Microbacterium sp. LRZ72 TaxID=2942481 RepID=UPI0029A4BC82|nr:nucleotidyltransferase domain-containing protein [Microbacterium sp. LRZ72]MDX2375211.1 nucleotidyltransferase domain-containing protein [Microbacterium sp. LRZ72]
MADVVSIAEARVALSRLVRRLAQDPSAEPVIIGSHRKPQAVLTSFPRSGGHDEEVPSLEHLRAVAPLIHRLAALSRLAEVRVYGSVARGSADDASDVDLLVTALPDATLFDVSQFEIDMEMLLRHPVSVVTQGALDSRRDATILAEALPL